MQTPARKLGWITAIALTAAMLATVLLAIGPGILHNDAPGSAASCPICHVAHISALPGLPVGLLAVSAPVSWFVFPAARVTRASAETLNASPRAPPA